MDTVETHCCACEAPIICPDDVAYSGPACTYCERRYPNALLKACFDQPFDYALRLRTGETWRFSGARIRGMFVTLTFDRLQRAGLESTFPFPRGVDVRVDDILWVADAPEGS